MIKRLLALGLLGLNAAITGCGGQLATSSSVLVDAENDTHQGIQAFAESNWQQAQRLFSRALSVYQGLDHQQGLLENSINLAEVALALHDYQAVHNYLDNASEIVKTHAMRDYQRRITLLKVQQALQENELTLAEQLLQPLLPTSKTAKADILQLTALADRAKIALMRHQDEAFWVQGFAEALQLSEIKNDELAARLLRFQANLLQSQGDFAASGFKLEQALSLYKNKQSRIGIALTLAELGELAIRQSKPQTALDYLNRSVAVYRYLGDKESVNQLTKTIEKLEPGH